MLVDTNPVPEVTDPEAAPPVDATLLPEGDESSSRVVVVVSA